MPSVIGGQRRSLSKVTPQRAEADLNESIAEMWMGTAGWRLAKDKIGSAIINTVRGKYDGITPDQADAVAQWIFRRTNYKRLVRGSGVDAGMIPDSGAKRGAVNPKPWTPYEKVNYNDPTTAPQLFLSPKDLNDIDQAVLGIQGAELAARAIYGIGAPTLFRGVRLSPQELSKYQPGRLVSLYPQSFIPAEARSLAEYMATQRGIPWRDTPAGALENVVYRLREGANTASLGQPGAIGLGVAPPEHIAWGDFEIGRVRSPEEMRKDGYGSQHPAGQYWGIDLEQIGLNPMGTMKGAPMGKAAGGYISGPGGPKSDSIPAMLSNGEYVMNANAVKKYGVDRMNAMNFSGGGLVPPIVPQPIPPAPPPPPPTGSSDPQAFAPLPPPPPSNPPPTGSSDPDAFKDLTNLRIDPEKIDPKAAAAGAISGALSPKGGGAGASASARGPRPKDPRAALMPAPTSDDHVNPALAAGIKGAFSTAGAIAGTAASLGITAGGARSDHQTAD
jgi:hypothetical protein